MAITKTGSSDPRQRRRDEANKPHSNIAGMGQAPEGSFKNYRQIPGVTPGLEDDGFGHFRYVPRPAA